MSNREPSNRDSPLSLGERGRDDGIQQEAKPMLDHGDFCIVRHGVANFLQQVYSTAEMLRSRLPDSSVQEQDLVKKLRLDGEVCKSLINNVQDYLAAQAISAEPISLSEVCTSLLVEFKDRFPSLDWHVAGDPSVVVQADFEALLACGRQLLINAVQAGASHVTIDVRSEGDSMIRWDIIDDGSGIHEPDQAKLFKPFAKYRPGQAGLGLALVSRSVLAMNGEVKLSNRESGGAQASVWLARGDASGRVV
jgi:signal transduction histidine kinase